MTDIRAITVRQPWAWAIAHGGKTIENRSTTVKYRGPLFIHAGAAWSPRGAEDQRVLHAWTAWLSDRPIELAHEEQLREWWERADVLEPDSDRERALLPRQALIAVAELVDVHYDTGCCRPWGESSYAESRGRIRTAVAHLVLEDVRPLDEPILCPGALGLWRLPADVVDAASVLDTLR
jgi:hypothetical protein